MTTTSETTEPPVDGWIHSILECDDHRSAEKAIDKAIGDGWEIVSLCGFSKPRTAGSMPAFDRYYSVLVRRHRARPEPKEGTPFKVGELPVVDLKRKSPLPR